MGGGNTKAVSLIAFEGALQVATKKGRSKPFLGSWPRAKIPFKVPECLRNPRDARKRRKRDAEARGKRGGPRALSSDSIALALYRWCCPSSCQRCIQQAAANHGTKQSGHLSWSRTSSSSSKAAAHSGSRSFLAEGGDPSTAASTTPRKALHSTVCPRT